MEIIRRKDGEKSTKQEIRHKNTQFSINSYGHICIREYDDEQSGYACELGSENCDNEKGGNVCFGHSCCHYKASMLPGVEHLLVLDQKTTDGLIKFIFENRSTFELKQFVKELIKNSKELPF